MTLSDAKTLAKDRARIEGVPVYVLKDGSVTTEDAGNRVYVAFPPVTQGFIDDLLSFSRSLTDDKEGGRRRLKQLLDAA